MGSHLLYRFFYDPKTRCEFGERKKLAIKKNSQKKNIFYKQTQAKLSPTKMELKNHLVLNKMNTDGRKFRINKMNNSNISTKNIYFATSFLS